MSESYPLLWMSRTPYAGTAARAGIDAALAFAVFAQAPEVVLCGDAVLSLLPAEIGQEQPQPSLRKVLDSMPLYDVDHLWVDLASLEQHGMAPAALPDYARCADDAKLRDLVARAGHVLSL